MLFLSPVFSGISAPLKDQLTWTVSNAQSKGCLLLGEILTAGKDTDFSLLEMATYF